MRQTPPKVGDSSPWDQIDHVSPVAGGIVSVSTPGHGGFWVPPHLNTQIPDCLRKDDGWYEEDCEYAIPVVCLSSVVVFDEKLIGYAHASLKSYWPDEYQTVTGKPVSLDESHTLRERAFRKANEGKLITVSAAGKPGGIVIVAACVNGRTPTYHYAGKVRYFAVPEKVYDKREGTFVVGDPDQTLYAEATEADFYA